MRARDLVEVQEPSTGDALALKLLERSPRGVGHEPGGIEDRHVSRGNAFAQTGRREQIWGRCRRGHEPERGCGPPETE